MSFYYYTLKSHTYAADMSVAMLLAAAISKEIRLAYPDFQL
ncbi:MAG: hypothetical protein V4660_13555 [Pseudomonadota bacterium]